MKKVILILSALFLSYTLTHAQTKLEPTEQEVLLKVLVSNLEGIPSQGDKITFDSKKTGIRFTGISDARGYFYILVPKGDSLDVMFQSFEKDSVLRTLVTPNTPGQYTINYKFKYQLPSEVRLENVYFDTGKATLQPTSFPSLDNLTELMLNKKTLRIEIGGHTDSDGSEAANLKLSEARAETVKMYLVQRGVEPERVETVGYGESMPITTNATEYGKSRNRRTEVRVLGQ